ncbi:hypothetical protein Bca4012_103235 [Brassica carinata]
MAVKSSSVPTFLAIAGIRLGLAVIYECYLVDPASSHMLVSKIKPCMCKRTTAKAFAKDVFINQKRKLGARRRSDTVLVSTISDADQGSADVAFRTPLAPYEKSKFLGSGSMVARLKLKGIVEGHHQEWSLRLNLTQHGKLTRSDIVRIDRLRALS